MSNTSPHRPIIYIRGYAGQQSHVEETVNRPYYGFNLGSSKLRTGPDGQPELFLFESPLIRLMKDHRYTDYFVRVEPDESGNRAVMLLKSAEEDDYPERSLWIYRYYDATSRELSESATRTEMEQLAEDLGLVIEYVTEKTGAACVYLVAHSMGGLVARCLLQNLWRHPATSRQRKTAKKKTGSAGDRSADAHPQALVDKLFTYGSPHGGIEFRPGLGWLANVRDLFGINDADVFGPARMNDYLNLRKKPPNTMTGGFDPGRVFCLVGSNYHDYDAAMGFSRRTVGPGSDGLVLQRNAYVKNANRAYVYRAHSGPYGIVNSEEGYQNLQRFLFGTTAVKLRLGDIKLGPALRNHADLEWLMVESEVAIRGETAQMHQQLEEHGSAIRATPRILAGQGETLYRTFLMADKRTDAADPSMHFLIRLRLRPKFVQRRRLRRDSYYAGQEIYDETLLLAITPLEEDGLVSVWYAWSELDADLPEEGERITPGHPHATPLLVGNPNPDKPPHIEEGSLWIEVEPWT